MNPEDDPEYWNSMGYSLALDGKRDKAQKYYEKTLEIDPDNVAALNNLANILLDQGKEDEALKYLKYTTQMHPRLCGSMDQPWSNKRGSKQGRRSHEML